MAWNAVADAHILGAVGIIIKPQKRFAPAQEHKGQLLNVGAAQVQQWELPPFKRDVRRW